MELKPSLVPAAIENTTTLAVVKPPFRLTAVQFALSPPMGEFASGRFISTPFMPLAQVGWA